MDSGFMDELKNKSSIKITKIAPRAIFGIENCLTKNIKPGQFSIIAKPNSRENKIMGYDKEKEAYIVSIKAKPENNKANIEVIKFFSKLLKKDVKIISGLKSREKLLKII